MLLKEPIHDLGRADCDKNASSDRKDLFCDAFHVKFTLCPPDLKGILTLVPYNRTDGCHGRLLTGYTAIKPSVYRAVMPTPSCLMAWVP